MIASYFGLEQIIKLLLEDETTDIDSTDGIHQRSALSWASENGFDGVVKLLIKRSILWKSIAKRWWALPASAEISARDIYGRTPLSYAAWDGHMTVFQRLVNAGASVNSKDEIGGTPIAYALCTGNEDVVDQLLDGTMAESKEDNRQELLLSAAKKGFEPTVKQLLDRGADRRSGPVWSDTASAGCAEQAGGHCFKLLIENGADVNTKDGSWETPVKMPNKPIKQGYKIFALAELGYIWTFIWSGKL